MRFYSVRSGCIVHSIGEPPSPNKDQKHSHRVWLKAAKERKKAQKRKKKP